MPTFWDSSRGYAQHTYILASYIIYHISSIIYHISYDTMDPRAHNVWIHGPHVFFCIYICGFWLNKKRDVNSKTLLLHFSQVSQKAMRHKKKGGYGACMHVCVHTTKLGNCMVYFNDHLGYFKWYMRKSTLQFFLPLINQIVHRSIVQDIFFIFAMYGLNLLKDFVFFFLRCTRRWQLCNCRRTTW
jgi:hypothetical protein